MRVEVRTAPYFETRDFCMVEKGVFDEISRVFASLEFHKYRNIPASKQIKNAFESYLKESGWVVNYPLINKLETDLPETNYHIDGIRDMEKCDCKFRHRFTIEFCFDNRQAIGTNLLKFEMANVNFSNNGLARIINLVICADKKSLKKLGWDSAIASSEEYELALRAPYATLISANIVFFVIRSD